MFEELNINNINFLKKPVLSALGTGKTNCVIIDSGHFDTKVSIVQDGFTVSNRSVKYGGNTINQIIEEIIR